ncbi:MAG: hypothetical protein OXH00_26235 [Candidatus Poribacteria bacterium]|nr:hypothetical protein [Candidatus Poribacteria bacterium]
MAINATITAPSGTQPGNFTVNITLEVSVTDLTAATLTVTPVSGNGITGVMFEVLPDDDMNSATHNVMFQLPEDVKGSLQVAITGMVTREGSSTPEAVVSTPVTVAYDNITTISVAFGTVDYRDSGVVVLPVTFGENVIAPSKTIFQFSDPSSNAGDGILGIAAYYLVGEDAAYALVVHIAEEKQGRFVVSADGYALKASSGVWDNVVVATPKTVSYGTIVPRIVDYEIPANYDLGTPVDVLVAFNVLVTGWHVNNTLTEIFIEEGVRLGTALPYKWTGTSPPDIHAAMPADLTGTDWTLLATPPAGDPTPNQNGFDTDGQWHGEEGQYFLIRFPDPQNTGILNLTLRENAVRGPIGS